MSPRKLTEDDKHEILKQYRNSEATTSTLAQSFEVSSSTISRFLKNNLSSQEYEELIQQKRLARTPRGEKSSSKAKSASQKTKTKTKIKTKSLSQAKQKKVEKAMPTASPKGLANASFAIANEEAMPELATAENLQLDIPLAVEPESKSTSSRRRRRRSTVTETVVEETIVPEVEEINETEASEIAGEAEPAPVKLVLDHKVRSKSDLEDVPKRELLILKSDRVESEEEDEDDAMDIITLKEMLGEDLEDINEEEDEEDEDDEDWSEEENLSYRTQRSQLSDLQILPLSQASLPRTCYLVIDRLAELIVKPLEDFADLGIIPEAEVKQRTLPVFDNHRIAKRFSHRRERVIKVPDGQMLQKTSHHLQEKGITRLLIDGQIYSLSN